FNWIMYPMKYKLVIIGLLVIAAAGLIYYRFKSPQVIFESNKSPVTINDSLGNSQDQIAQGQSGNPASVIQRKTITATSAGIYTNSTYHYGFAYPAGTVITEAGADDFGVPDALYKQGQTSESLF